MFLEGRVLYGETLKRVLSAGGGGGGEFIDDISSRDSQPH